MRRIQSDAEPAETAGYRHGYAAVIGDVVRSRRGGPSLFDHVQEALARTNERIEALQPLQITIGDEFQGVYRRLGQALNATLLIHLLLHELAEVRFGVGWGDFTRWSPDRAPYEQDGPAWWAAREALESVHKHEGGHRIPAGWKTAVRLDPASPDRHEQWLEQEASFRREHHLAEPRPVDLSLDVVVGGLVMFRDHVLSRLDRRDVSLVLAVLEGATVTKAASQLEISQQAASRRLRTNGGYALINSWEVLGGAT